MKHTYIYSTVHTQEKKKLQKKKEHGKRGKVNLHGSSTCNVFIISVKYTNGSLPIDKVHKSGFIRQIFLRHSKPCHLHNLKSNKVFLSQTDQKIYLPLNILI